VPLRLPARDPLFFFQPFPSFMYTPLYNRGPSVSTHTTSSPPIPPRRGRSNTGKVSRIPSCLSPSTVPHQLSVVLSFKQVTFLKAPPRLRYSPVCFYFFFLPSPFLVCSPGPADFLCMAPKCHHPGLLAMSLSAPLTLPGPFFGGVGLLLWLSYATLRSRAH